MTPGRRAILAAVSVNLIGVLPLFLTGAMAVQIGRDLAINPATVGVLASLFALASMLGSAPAGRRVGIWGVRRSLRISSSLAMSALLLAAIAPSVAALGVALFVAGLGNGLGQPAGNALVAAQISPRRYGLGFAIKQSAIPLATMLGGLAVPLIALTVGWRAAFVLAGIAALVAMFIVPEDREVTRGRSESPVPRKSVLPLWALAIGASAAVFAATSIGALGAAGGVAAGLPESTAGYLVALGGLAGLAIRLGSGVMADRATFDSLHAVSALCVLGAFGWAAMATGSVTAFACGLVVANAFGWGWPGLLHLSIARRFPTSTAAASGISQTGISTGLFVGPGALGIIATTAGWQWTWSAAAVAALIGAGAIWAAAARIPETSAGKVLAPDA